MPFPRRSAFLQMFGVLHKKRSQKKRQGYSRGRSNIENQEKMRDREGDAQSSPWDILISVKLFLDGTKTEVCFPRGPQSQQACVVAILNIHQQPLHNAISTSSDEFICRAVPRIFYLRGQTSHTFTGVSRIQTGFLVGRFVFTPTQKVASKTFKETNHTDAFGLNCHDIMA